MRNAGHGAAGRADPLRNAAQSHAGPFSVIRGFDLITPHLETPGNAKEAHRDAESSRPHTSVPASHSEARDAARGGDVPVGQNTPVRSLWR